MEQLESVLKMLTEITEDRRVPRNIREAAEATKKNLEENEREWDVKLSTAISTLDEITNDPNMPGYTRTQIWNIVSMLEIIKNGLS